MAVKLAHGDNFTLYYCTFTCYKWLNLFEIVNGYDIVYKWFDYLKTQNQQVIGFVIMPNHVHAILYSTDEGYNLNKIIGNAKRFMAYEIIKRLEEMQREDLLQLLHTSVSKREKKKGQRHKVFKDSFDAKGIATEKFLLQKLNYIHRNPVSGKWNLVVDYTDYEHSSAPFYELVVIKKYQPFDFRII